jgi:hypothetical protein
MAIIADRYRILDIVVRMIVIDMCKLNIDATGLHGNSDPTFISPRLTRNTLEQLPTLLDQVRDLIRLKHYSMRTERAYADWIKRFIFHHKRHPKEMGAPEIQAFLTYLAVGRNVAASTQQQALSALLSPYHEVLRQELPWMDDITRAQKPKRLSAVLTYTTARQHATIAPEIT